MDNGDGDGALLPDRHDFPQWSSNAVMSDKSAVPDQ